MIRAIPFREEHERVLGTHIRPQFRQQSLCLFMRDGRLHPALKSYLEAYLATRPAPSRPYFFCAPPSHKFPKGDHTINLRDLNEAFQKLAKSLGMKVGRKVDGLVIHSLRHIFETCCVDSMVPQFLVEAWMGHAGQASMGRVYYGTTDRKSKKFIKRVKFVLRPKAPVALETSVAGARSERSGGRSVITRVVALRLLKSQRPGLAMAPGPSADVGGRTASGVCVRPRGQRHFVPRQPRERQPQIH